MAGRAPIRGTAFPDLQTERVRVGLAVEDDAPYLLAFHTRNRAFLAPWLPPLAPEFFTLPFWKRWAGTSPHLFHQDQAARFVLKMRDPRHPTLGAGRIIGQINFANIVRGPWQACTVGYHLDRAAEGMGLMGEALDAAVVYMFEVRRLHRVMANFIPDNDRSGALLDRLGFEREGYARNYLFINGAWRDHVLTSRINPDLPVPEWGGVPLRKDQTA